MMDKDGGGVVSKEEEDEEDNDENDETEMRCIVEEALLPVLSSKCMSSARSLSLPRISALPLTLTTSKSTFTSMSGGVGGEGEGELSRLELVE